VLTQEKATPTYKKRYTISCKQETVVHGILLGRTQLMLLMQSELSLQVIVGLLQAVHTHTHEWATRKRCLFRFFPHLAEVTILATWLLTGLWYSPGARILMQAHPTPGPSTPCRPTQQSLGQGSSGARRRSPSGHVCGAGGRLGGSAPSGANGIVPAPVSA